MDLLSGGPKRNLVGSVLECGMRVSTVVSFDDEENPPCRAVQGGAGKHRGESEAYTNLAGGWKEGTLLVGGEEAGEA